MSAQNGSRLVRSLATRSKGPRSRSQQNKNKSRVHQMEIPSLKEFVHRQKVIRQYRGFFRVLKCIDDEQHKVQMKNEIKQSFSILKNANNAIEEEKLAISMSLTEGERKLKELKSMVGYVDGKEKSDPDSWLNIKDKEDPRGRIGSSWPWQKD